MTEAVRVVLEERLGWEPPAGYLDRNVSSKAIKIILGYLRDRTR